MEIHGDSVEIHGDSVVIHGDSVEIHEDSVEIHEDWRCTVVFLLDILVGTGLPSTNLISRTHYMGRPVLFLNDDLWKFLVLF